MMRLTLEGVEALDAVVRHGSFAAAADALHKAQSAVSYQVRSLEDALGVALFDRSGHRARLTPEGAALLEEGRRLLQQARAVEALARRFGEGWEPRLEVLVDGGLPIAPIVRALKQLDEEGVPTHVRVSTEFLGGVQRAFERHDADLMIAKELRRDPGLDLTPLPDEELVLVARSDHPACDGPQEPVALRRHLELAVHDTSDETAGHDTHDLGGPRVFYVADFHAKREALRTGLGLGWMPRRLVEADLAADRLREVRSTSGSRRRFTPWLATRVDRPLGRAGRRLRELVIAGWPPTEAPG